MQVIRFDELADYLATGHDFIVELGEQKGIGSSSLIIRKCGKTILVDRGLAFEGAGNEKLTTFPAGANLEGIHIDIMIFTHVHADHAGLIVPTILTHEESRVIFSRKTLEELKIVLADSLSIQRKETQKSYFSGLPAPVAMFNEEDVATFIARAEGGFYEVLDTDDEEDVWISWEDWPGWDFGFTFSGHTPGSFISFIKTPDGDGIVATGDVCGHDQETTKGIPMPRESFLKMADFRKCRRIILITEATNGNRDREESQEEMDARLKAVLAETERKGGHALFPVFMVNRGPNIVMKLVRLGFKVFVAGGVRKTMKAEIPPALLEQWLKDGTVMTIQNGKDYEEQLRSAAHGKFGFRPVVTSSATLDQGAGVDFAIEMLSVSENVLISTGHRFDGSAMQEFFEIKNKPLGPGHTIVLNKMDRNFHQVKKVVNVRCNGHHFDYTAHSYRKELVTLAAGLNPDVVFVKHCTQEGFKGLETALQSELGEKCPPVSWARHLHLFEL
jgi:Cft2 family RNA processing exonuclease